MHLAGERVHAIRLAAPLVAVKAGRNHANRTLNTGFNPLYKLTFASFGLAA